MLRLILGARLPVSGLYLVFDRLIRLLLSKMTNRQFYLSDMTFRRRNAGVVSHDGLLYVVGGDDGSTNLSNVEVSWHLTLVKNYEFE